MQINDIATSLYKVTIPSGTKVSNKLQLPDGNYPVGIFHPIINTSTVLNFNVAEDENSTLVVMEDGGSSAAAYSVGVINSAAGYIPLDVDTFRGIKVIQIAVADDQSADRVFNIALRGI